MYQIRHVGPMLILCVPLMFASCMPGQRLLQIQIESEGKVVYEGWQGVPDSTPVEEMWGVLGDVRFEPTNAEASTTDESRVVRGNVVLRILHTDDELANASLERLKLTYDEQGNAWKLEESEVERVTNAAEQ